MVRGCSLPIRTQTSAAVAIANALPRPILLNPGSGDDAGMSATIGCPACGKPVPVEPANRPASFPFCTPRCRLLDLGAWCDGKYTIAGQPLPDPDEDSNHL